MLERRHTPSAPEETTERYEPEKAAHLSLVYRKGKAISFHFAALLLMIFLAICMSGKSYAIPLYYGTGSVQVGIYGDGLQRVTNPAAVTSVIDSEKWLHSSLAYAESTYYGSLETGSVGAVAYAVNGYIGGEWVESLAGTMVEIYDTLYFTIPAGNYPDGVSVEATGYVGGTRSDSYWGQSRFWFEAYLGDGNFSVGENFGLNGSHYDVVDKDFKLVDQLLSPGTVLNASTVIARPVRINLGGPMTLFASTYWNGGGSGIKEETFASSDFYNTGGLYQINTPSDVTWRSASGVFLSQAKPVRPIPEPASLLLLVGGLGLLMLWKRKCVAHSYM